jgi:hypothetical protein
VNDEMTALREVGEKLDETGTLPEGLRSRVVAGFGGDVVPMRRRRAPWIAAGAGVAATAVAALVGVTMPAGGSDDVSNVAEGVDATAPGATSPDAEATLAVVPAALILESAAEVAAAEPWGEVPGNKFVYYKSSGCSIMDAPDPEAVADLRASGEPGEPIELDGVEMVSYLIPQEYERWLAVDGSQAGKVIIDEDVSDVPLDIGDGHDERPIAGGDPGYESDAPTEADAMYEYLLTSYVGDTSERTDADVRADRAGGLLGGYLAPEQQAAVFGALQRIEGAEVVQDVTDEAGRPGVGVAFGGYTFVFDADTYEYLGSQTTLDDGRTCGSAVTALEIVDAVGDRG